MNLEAFDTERINENQGGGKLKDPRIRSSPTGRPHRAASSKHPNPIGRAPHSNHESWSDQNLWLETPIQSMKEKEKEEEAEERVTVERVSRDSGSAVVLRWQRKGPSVGEGRCEDKSNGQIENSCAITWGRVERRMKNYKCDRKIGRNGRNGP